MKQIRERWRELDRECFEIERRLGAVARRAIRDETILGPAKQPTEGKVFGNVIEECLEAFFSACCEDVKYTQSQEYFADFAENNEFEFYENGICIRHR